MWHKNNKLQQFVILSHYIFKTALLNNVCTVPVLQCTIACFYLCIIITIKPIYPLLFVITHACICLSSLSGLLA